MNKLWVLNDLQIKIIIVYIEIEANQRKNLSKIREFISLWKEYYYINKYSKKKTTPSIK